MPRPDYTTCRSCGKHRDECGKLSHTRLCYSCGKRRLNRNVDGLMTKSGLPWRRWQVGIVTACGGVLLDDSTVNTQTDDRAG